MSRKDPDVRTHRRVLNGGLNVRQVRLQRAQTSERQFDDREFPALDFLLVSQVLVAREEHVELPVDEGDQLAIPLSGPALVLHGDHFEFRKEKPQGDGQILIKQDRFHGRV